jgi:hypothetical protein
MNLGEMLAEAIQKRMADQQKFQKVHDAIVASGGTCEDFHQIRETVESFDALATTVGLCVTLVKHRNHLPSAKLGLEAATYLKDAAAWIERILTNAKVDPEVFGMKRDCTEFYHIMDRDRAMFTSVIETAEACRKTKV